VDLRSNLAAESRAKIVFHIPCLSGQQSAAHTRGRVVETPCSRVGPPGTKGIHDDEDADEPKGGQPGPTDEGREGGMATRENAPDVAETDQEPTA
jgi:hypothetical protein